jgi:hypothetical protein
VVLTLGVRLAERKDVFRAHKEHLYQLWLQHRDPDHGRLAFMVWGLCAVCSLIGLGAHAIDAVWRIDVRFPLLVLVVAALSALWISTRRRLLNV